MSNPFSQQTFAKYRNASDTLSKFNLSINILLLLSLSYFLYKNITKPYNYIERYSLYWPNVVEGKYIYK